MNNGSPQSAHSAAKNGIQGVSSYSLVACLGILVCFGLWCFTTYTYRYYVEGTFRGITIDDAIGIILSFVPTLISIIFFLKILVITTKASKLNIVSQICLYSLFVILAISLIGEIDWLTRLVKRRQTDYLPDSVIPAGVGTLFSYANMILNFAIGISFFLLSAYFKSHKRLFLITIIVGISFLSGVILAATGQFSHNPELYIKIHKILSWIYYISFALFYLEFWLAYRKSLNTQ